MKEIIYDPDALHKHPSFEDIRNLISRDPPPEARELLDHFSNTKNDINTLLKPMYNLLCDIGAKTIVELGVRWGSSTVAFLVYCHCNDSRLYSVDIEDCGVAKSIMKALGLMKYWTFTQINDIEYVNIWNRTNRMIDFLFIDTDHTYELTTKELDIYNGFVRKGGIIFFHDSDKEGVVMAYNEFLKKSPNWTSIYDDKYLPLKGKAIKRIE